MGYIVEAVVNYIALLGWSPSDNQEIFSLEELKEKFNISGLSKSPAIFDINKLSWMNGEYLKAMDFDRFYSLAEKRLNAAIKDPSLDKKKIAALIKTRLSTLNEIAEMVDFFSELPDYSTELYVHKKMKSNEEIALNSLQKCLPVLEDLDDWTNDSLYETLVDLVQQLGLKNGQMVMASPYCSFW